jgi:hypothetical protein
MKKIVSLIPLFALFLLTACTEEDDNSRVHYTESSSEANCYMLAPGDSINIPVSRVTTAGGTLTSVWTAGLLWTDNSNKLSASGVVSSITADITNGYIKVLTGSAEGNAVIYIKNSSNVIIWSWHLWVTKYDPDGDSITYIHNNYTFMDRNLGATTSTGANANSYGLLYQWGRKDPFPGSTTLSTSTTTTIYTASGAATLTLDSVKVAENLTNSISNPLTFYYGRTANEFDWFSATAGVHNDSLWGGYSLDKPAAKSVYDPCPLGWRVPTWENNESPWSNFPDSWGATAFGDTWDGDFWAAAGRRRYQSGVLQYISDYGYYWSGSATDMYGYCLEFNVTGVNTAFKLNRASGLPVRCVKM